ncbi:MAG: TIGR03905 family TSCPD domain-containing protein [Bacilli bacterium]|nr:TIGR03905 family TSCPD domain-containing protein [Bacilli bacterium]
MATYTFTPSGVCSRQYTFEIENGIILKATIVGGCQGNLTGISSLLEGMSVEEAVKRLRGITCRGSRSGKTSCPDQISLALESIL